MSSPHKPTFAAAIVAILVAVAALVTALTGGLSKHEVAVSSKAQSKVAAKSVLLKTAVAANVAVQSTPNPDCNPPAGAGRAGICAPVGAQAAVATIAKKAGDPEHVTGLLGVDVSSYQRCLTVADFRVLAFAYAKATEGTRYVDPHLRCNVAAARAAHKPLGAYDFLHPSPFNDPKVEARHFIDAVVAAGAHRLPSLPPAADLEINQGLSPQGVHRYLCAWHAAVQSALHRAVDVTYTGNWFFGPSVAGGTCGTKLWVSAYTFAPIIPVSWGGGLMCRLPRCVIWQFSGDGVGPTPHYQGKWDTDVFAGNLAQLRELAGQKETRQQARLRHARRSHRIVHAKIHKRCRGHVAHHSAGCHALFRRNGQLHARYGKALG